MCDATKEDNSLQLKKKCCDNRLIFFRIKKIIVMIEYLESL